MCYTNYIFMEHHVKAKVMIRNPGNIFLSLLVLCATTGLAVNKHYSNGELFSASLYSSPETCCQVLNFCYCCHEETERFKITDYFRTSSQQNLPKNVQDIVLDINAIKKLK
ncbi:MAG: HYC_CC_PP family protein [Bacteroidota bacterium]